jgi:hypothetical protein
MVTHDDFSVWGGRGRGGGGNDNLFLRDEDQLELGAEQGENECPREGKESFLGKCFLLIR